MFNRAQLHIRNYDAGEIMTRHEHDEASLNIVFRGDFVEWSGKAERIYERGHVTYCPAGFAHAQAFGRGGASQIIVRPLSDWIDYLVDSKIILEDGPHASAAVFAQVGDRLAKELSCGDAFSALACEGMILEIVATFGRFCHKPAEERKPPLWLCMARDFIQDNGLGPITLQDVALAAGRHEIHVAREFRRYFGAPIGVYVRRVRVDHAAKLLAKSELSVSEIALECGFSSHSHLCREFKSQLGVTPMRYRRGG